MKKFITAIVSLVLAGSMAFGIAACGGNGNQNDDKDPNQNQNSGDNQEKVLTAEEWAKMFEDLYELDNHTYEAKTSTTVGLLYNRKFVTADTKFESETLTQSVEALREMFGLNGENPATTESGSVTKVDLTQGVIESPSGYGDNQNDYFIVDGTTVNEYSWRKNATDTDGYYNLYRYVGYDSNAQATEYVRKNANPFRFLLAAQLCGTGEYADVKGTMSELYELFEYDETTGIYSAIIAVDPTNPESGEGSISVKVENGAIKAFSMNVETVVDVAETTGDPSLKGLTYVMIMSSGAEITDIGTTRIIIPDDLDERVEHTVDYPAEQ